MTMILVTSLVGMTMGARKRAALRDSISARPDGLAKTKIPSVRRMMNGAALASLSHDESIRTETRTRYAAARARYRIGERLRPCPGCPYCTVDPVPVRRLPKGYRVIFLLNGYYYATTKMRRGVAAWSVVPDGVGWRHASFARSLVCFKGSELVTIADVGHRACDGSGVLPARRAGR